MYCPSFADLREKLFASAAQLLGNRWHCPSDMKKKNDSFLNDISHDDFDTNVYCYVLIFSISNHLFSYSTVSANSTSLCTFCSVVMCEVIIFFFIAIVNNISSLDEVFFSLRGNVVINIVYR